LDGEDLLGDDRENLNVNTVELVETGPSTTLSKTAKKSAHSFVVKTVGTIENYTLHS
jgi:hypothetical protein